MSKKTPEKEMEEHIRQNILQLIDELIEALKKRNIDVIKIKQISNHINHTLSVYQDEDSKQIAIITYSLYQIFKLEEKKYKAIDIPSIISILKKAGNLLRQKKISIYKKEMQKIITEIAKTDKRINLYIDTIIRKAELSKGIKLYEHGLSLGKSSEISGITQWELMNYAGKTILPEEYDTKDVLKKIKYAKKIFNIKPSKKEGAGKQ